MKIIEIMQNIPIKRELYREISVSSDTVLFVSRQSLKAYVEELDASLSLFSIDQNLRELRVLSRNIHHHWAY